MNVLEQSVVDQRLVVRIPSLVHLIPEILQYGLVQANGEILVFPGSGLTTAPRLAREKSMSRYRSAAAFFIEHPLAFVRLPRLGGSHSSRTRASV